MTRIKVCVGVCLFAAILALPATAQDEVSAAAPPEVVPEGAVPRLVRFSGVLQTAYGEPRSGLLGVTFALYREQAGGAPLWVETQNVEVDAEGRYTVLLGATRTEGVPADLFTAGEARWLGIQVKGEKEQRVLLVSVPYALKAGDAETLGGKPASAFVQVSPDKATVPPGTQSNALGAVAPFYTATSDGLPSLISLTTTAPPLTVLSTQMVTNLNADMLDGMHASQFGDITAVLPGVGLMDGGATGDVTLNVNTAVIQARVTGTCAAGESIQSIDQAGAVVCETDSGADVAGTGVATTAARSDHTHEAAPLGQGNTGVGPAALAANAGASNTAVGVAALQANVGGFGNTAVGRDALLSNSGGSNNTAVGTFALDANTAGNNNTALGVNAMGSNGAGDSNTAVGFRALFANNAGFQNTAFGQDALFSNVIGSQNTALGTNALFKNTESGNTAVGLSALQENTTGSANVAVGGLAAISNTSGNNNTALGHQALANNILSSNNTAVGRAALQMNIAAGNTAVGAFALDANTSGSANTAVGSNALGANVSSTDNTAVGANALSAVVNGFNNTAVGSGALASSTANSNTAVGSLTLFSNTTGQQNTAVGAFALNANVSGTDNTAVGTGALQVNTANNNTAVGSLALDANTTGSNNTAVGRGALGANQNGTENTAVGLNALAANTDVGNTAVGANALDANTTGSNNTAVGLNALGANLSGFDNTAVGRNALLNSTGSDNIAIGAAAGANATTGSANIYIGHPGSAAESGRIRIGVAGVQGATFIGGIRGVTTGNANAIAVLIDSAGQLGTVSSTRRVKEDIGDLGGASAGLLRLRPVTFRYKQPAADGSKPLQYGLIAEEVAEVMPEIVVLDADGQPETVQYHVLPVLLLNELQRQHKQLEQQTAELAELRARLEKQDAELAELKAALRTTLAQR